MSKGNGRPLFRVVYSELIRQRLKQLLASLEAAGRRQEALSALRIIDRRLQREARTYGEPHHSHGNLQLEVRTAVEPPLAVTWAVHKHKDVVFVKAFEMLSPPP